MAKRSEISLSSYNVVGNPLEQRLFPNGRALRSLARAISLPADRFSLILVRCNDDALKQRALQSLRDDYAIEPQILVLPETARSLFSALQKNEHPSQCLIVFGLETLTHLDEFLIATNQMRNEFRSTFRFPLVLWVNDETIHKMIKLAPDFYSWANTPINVE
ncbi:MAG: hypothetical protein KME45_24505 [Stenomitos rutilans HA7619-LM2]|nr:hypothetical protein [Stenomitos rutilans HA7619-LM2]